MREKPNDSVADIIVCRDVHKWFGNFEALRGISLSIKTGEVVVIIGPSGSGKSTFIRTLNHLEQHEQGQIIIDGIELTHDTRNIQEIRAEVGMVFQSFNLFPHLTVLENIMLAPLNVRRWPREKAQAVAVQWLERVGIPEQGGKYPGQLSGGQQQRVGIARAVVTDPTLIVADEPTGDLDAKSAEEILDLLEELRRSLNKTILLVTHDTRAAQRADRIQRLDKGRLVDHAE